MQDTNEILSKYRILTANEAEEIDDYHILGLLSMKELEIVQSDLHKTFQFAKAWKNMNRYAKSTLDSWISR